MPAAIFRVLRPFAVALAMIVTVASAHAQTVPTITLPLTGTIHRDQPIRPTGQQPYWVSRADCLAQDKIYFTVTMTNYVGFTLEVWAGNAGVDCTPVDQRQGPAAQCWRVYSAAAQINITTIPVKATDLVSRTVPGMPPPSTDLRTVCTGTGSPKGQQLNLTFMFVQGGATIYGTPQLWKDIGYDITAPAPPINIKASPGETRLHMSWTQNQDGDTFQYRFYCDPPPGSVYPDGGLKPMNTSLWGTVSQAQMATGGTAGNGGASGAGGFVDTGGASGTAGVTAAGGSAGAAGAAGAGGTAGAVSTGGTSGTSGSTGTGGGDNTASCSASSVLVGGVDPTYPDSLDKYVCGTVGGLGISTGGTIEGLVNNVQYAVAMAAVDQVGNVGVLSPAVCATPAEVTDFFELYRAVGGKGGGGICSLSRIRNGAPLGGVLSATGLFVFAGAVRRARRRRQ